METIEYRTKDKSSWGEGPWQSEPDKKQWLDEETGLPCLIVRNHGAWCGYVGVSEGHPLFGKGDEDADIEVHGGITFTGACQDHRDETEGICHRPSPGEPDHVWWLGFDCDHAWDLDPSRAVRERQRYGWEPAKEEVYRDQAYVESECRKLAKQLKYAAPPQKQE